MKTLFISLSLIFQFFSCQNNGGKAEIKMSQDTLLVRQFTKRVDKKNGFEIMYPESWIMDSKENFEFPDAVFEAHFTDSAQNFYKLITFMIADKMGDTTIFNGHAKVGDTTLFFSYSGFMDENVTEIINWHKKDLSNIISSKKDLVNTISGLQFYLAEITHLQYEDSKRVFRMIAGSHAVKDSITRMMFILIYCHSANTESDSTNKILFQEIIKSFRLID